MHGRTAHSAERMRDLAHRLRMRDQTQMARTTIEEKALRLLRTFERAGRSVGRVTVDGKKIEIVFTEPNSPDEFERINMRHDKA